MWFFGKRGFVPVVVAAACMLASTSSSALAATRTMVILDSIHHKAQFSTFFSQLEERGHELQFLEADRDTASLFSYGVREVENLVLFAPKAKAFASLKSDQILEFIEDGGNVLAASSKKVSSNLQSLAAECGVQYHKAGTLVMDHFSFVEDPQDVYHATIRTTDVTSIERVAGSLADADRKSMAPIIFRGTGMFVDPDSIFAFPVLRPSPTAYVGSPAKAAQEGRIAAAGDDISLVTAVQARNNARMVFSGSLDLFSDAFMNSKLVPDTSNAQFSKHVSSWTFGETGVLDVQNVKHARADGSQPAKMLSDPKRPDQPVTLYPDAEVARESLVYRIKDNLTYSFDVKELVDGHWRPFQADDVQLEFVMLDAHVRKTMSHDGNGHFSVTFTSPDTYGIFKFRVMYRRRGLSTFHLSTQVSLRPFKHDEYERFIVAAFPYYASAFSMMAGVFLLSFFVLYSK